MEVTTQRIEWYYTVPYVGLHTGGIPVIFRGRGLTEGSCFAAQTAGGRARPPCFAVFIRRCAQCARRMKCLGSVIIPAVNLPASSGPSAD